MKKIFSPALLALSLAGLCLSARPASAASYEINASGGWLTPATWTSTAGDYPLATDTISITTLTANRSVSLAGNQTNGTVSGTYTVAGLSFNSSHDATFNGVGGTGAPDLWITGDLIKEGSGTLHFENRASGGNIGVHIGGDLDVKNGLLDFGVSSGGSRLIMVDGKMTIRSGAAARFSLLTDSTFGTLTVESGSTLLLRSDTNRLFSTTSLSGSGAITLTNTNSSNTRTFTLSFAPTEGHTTFSGSIIQSTTSPKGMKLSASKSGAGRQTLSGTTTFNSMTISGGVLEMSGSSTLAGVQISLTGGILGLGNGDLVRTLGSTADTDQVSISGAGSGLAAYGADRTVTFNDNAALTWGSGGFNPSTNLALSDASATHRLTLTNSIALGAAARTITVGDGAAAVDAELSGVLSATDSRATITKAGAGTLLLSGNNTYVGSTTVSEGTLLVSGTNGTGSGAVSVSTGATLGGTGSITAPTITLASGATLLGGNGVDATGALSLSGNLTLSSGSILKLTLGEEGAHSSLVRLGGTWTFAPDQQVLLAFDGIASAGSYTGLLTGLAVDPGVESWSFLNPGVVGNFTWNAGSVDLVVVSVPEPGTFGLLALVCGGAALFRAARRRAA